LRQAAAAAMKITVNQGLVMLFLRVLGKTFLLVAFIALAYDGARILATPGEGVLLTPLSTHLKTYMPAALESLEHLFLIFGAPYLWAGIVKPMLGLPASLLFGALGALLFLAGYRKPPPEIVSG
jgi:hypothetical protein